MGLKGRVEISRAGSSVWDPAQTNLVLLAGDGLRVGESSRATLRLKDATIANVAELTQLRVQGQERRAIVELLQGVMSFFHRDKPGDVEVRGVGAAAIIRGTEFVASINPAGELEVVVMEGAVDLENELGSVSAGAGEVASAGQGAKPRKATGLASANREAIQWTLYYPAVLDPSELVLDAKWSEAVGAYRRGDLWSALETARAVGAPETDAELILRAALELSTGDVRAMERLVGKVAAGSKESRLAEALRTVARASQFEVCETSVGPELMVTELLARSFCAQSRGDLKTALRAAEAAVAKAPGSGIALGRLGELQLAHGQLGEAAELMALAEAASPRSAAVSVTRGFIEAAQGRFAEAHELFDRAIALDAAIGDAWLGRGLVRFRRGDREGGRVDIEAAAASEPNRSVMRSYLGKAFAEEGSDERALAELERARALDEKDPTAWLYSALIKFRGYDLPGAIGDLEESSARNQNRAVFRSAMLLDQDAAVRSANLANIYEMADMAEVARRESARAVMFDYSNFSAHLNLASSFNALRDPTRFNLRAETVWFNEHLLASLLAPTDAAPLSQTLSQNEYSRLFARNRVGFASGTEYISARGEVREVATQFGNFDRISYAVDLDSAWMDGERPNQDLERVEVYARLKGEITEKDSLFLLAKAQDYESGDLYQYADPSLASATARFEEKQFPLTLVGYHREWGPGSHTLALAGRLENEQRAVDPARSQFLSVSFPAIGPTSAPFGFQYGSEFEIYTAELSHILESERHTTIVGGRAQGGDFKANAFLNDSQLGGFAGDFGGTTFSGGAGDFERYSSYVYHTWEIIDDLRVTGGVSYDDITGPANFRRAPLRAGEMHRERISPKAAVIYSPAPLFTARAMYAQSLSGVSYDQSVTLEPTQLAGFAQSFRSLISESFVGSVELPQHNVAAAALDFKFQTRTYLSVEGGDLRSDVREPTGYFDLDITRPAGAQGIARQAIQLIDYAEQYGRANVSQMLAEEWFANGMYQFAHADLDREYRAIAPGGFSRSAQADLHRVGGSLLYQRRDGWFGRFALTYLRQEFAHQQLNGAFTTGSESVAFGDLFVGWRFPRLRGDLTVGVLNLFNSDYRLSPLTAHEEFVRRRSFYLRFRLNL